jgi:hypothetical protein
MSFSDSKGKITYFLKSLVMESNNSILIIVVV